MHALSILPLDHGDIRLTDSVASRQDLLDLRRVSDLNHLCVGEFARPPLPVGHLAHILRLSSGGEMGGVDAGRIVTGVEDVEPGRYGAVVQLMREDVRTSIALIAIGEPAVALTVLFSQPRPALFRSAPVDLRPEPLLDSRGSHAERVSSLLEALIMDVAIALTLAGLTAPLYGAFLRHANASRVSVMPPAFPVHFAVSAGVLGAFAILYGAAVLHNSNVTAPRPLAGWGGR